jgi:hypothetical protein
MTDRTEDFASLGEFARRIVERLEANRDQRFVIPGMEGPTVTMRLSDYDALRSRVDELTKALEQIHRLSREGAAWKHRAMESRRIAGDALRGHE